MNNQVPALKSSRDIARLLRYLHDYRCVGRCGLSMVLYRQTTPRKSAIDFSTPGSCNGSSSRLSTSTRYKEYGPDQGIFSREISGFLRSSCADAGKRMRSC